MLEAIGLVTLIVIGTCIVIAIIQGIASCVRLFKDVNYLLSFSDEMNRRIKYLEQRAYDADTDTVMVDYKTMQVVKPSRKGKKK